MTSLAVLVIGWLYIVPQLHGAGITLVVVAGLPEWVGAVTIAVLVAAIGGTVTYRQWARQLGYTRPMQTVAAGQWADVFGLRWRLTPVQLPSPGEPPAGRHHQHRVAVVRHLTEVGHGRRKGRRVGGHPVAHPAEVRQAGHVGPASSCPHRCIVEGF